MYLLLYNNVTSVCIFIDCCRDLLKDTDTDGVSGLVFLFSCPPPPPEIPSINHLKFYCIKHIDYIFPCICTVIDHKRRISM